MFPIASDLWHNKASLQSFLFRIQKEREQKSYNFYLSIYALFHIIQ